MKNRFLAPVIVLPLLLPVMPGVQAQMAQDPLLVRTGSVLPNIVFMYDNSASMPGTEIYQYGGTAGVYGMSGPNSVSVGTGDVRSTGTTVTDYLQQSPDVNLMYYNPRLTYSRRINWDGTYQALGTSPNADFYVYFFKDASNANSKWKNVPTTLTTGNFFVSSYTPTTADLASGASVIAYPNRARSTTTTYPKFRNRTDCTSSPTTTNPTVCTWAEEYQNYKNWYTYHRSRLEMARTGIGLAFQPLNPTFRLGWGTINTLHNSSVLDAGVKKYDDTIKQNFFTWLYSTPGNVTATPNRSALNKVGTYFKRKDDNGPWGDNPNGNTAITSASAANASHASCRRSYALLMTDGYYNDSFTLTDVDTSTATAITAPTTYQYTPIGPYSDTRTGTKINNTFGDVALKYWVDDLRTDVDNNVKPLTSDEAYWQHLNFYAIGMGLIGTLDATDTNVLKSLTGTTSSVPARTRDWPSPTTNDPKAIDDMWHATVNGRGKMMNAANAVDLNSSISAMMADVNGNEGTQSGVAVSTASLTNDTKKYTPSYTPVSWAGNVTAYRLNSTTGNQTTIAWQVETLIATDPITGQKTYTSTMPAHGSRNIFAGNGDTSGSRAVAFTYSALNTAGLLPSMTNTGSPLGINNNLIDYLRGDATNEDTSSTVTNPAAIYRYRPTRLGDIVNSTPVFVKDSLDMAYEKLPLGTSGQSSYRAFVDGTGAPAAGGKKQRAEGMLFVGANDGMLHGFRDGTYHPTTGAVINPGGVETFAYVPNALLPSMVLLADKAYTHRYYADGPIAEADAYFNSGTPRWVNLVIGSTGAGAGTPSSAGTSPRTAVFAVDVSSINTSPTGLGASNVVWEASSSQTAYAEMGYVLSEVQTGTTPDGSWVAIFGNGYESKSCQARLFVVNLETGTKIKEINTGSGNCSTAKNGLGGVRVVRNANQQIIGAYAGDLQGNLWKFNLNNTSTASWGVDLGGSPLFATGSTQPFTATPGVTSLPNPAVVSQAPAGGYMVVAGTGKFHEVVDISNTSQQSLYGIWDPLAFGASTIPAGTSLTNTSLLVPQTIGTAQTGANGNIYFNITNNVVDYRGQTTPTVIAPRRGWYINYPNSGQRLVYPVELLANRIATIDTISPSNVSLDPCINTGSGTGWFYLLDAFTGGGFNEAVLDTNGDGNINSSDLVVSGVQSKADGRNVTLTGDSNALRTRYVNVSGGSAGATQFQITCQILGNCQQTGGSGKIRNKEWRQIFMR